MSVVTDNSVDTFTNKTITDTSNNVTAKSLYSATTIVDVSASTAPTSGQVLQASSGTSASWATPASGGGFTATTLKTAAYTAASGDWVICDANAAAGDIDISLPATPTVGDMVLISLVTEHATRKVTINRNGSTIDGGTAAEFQDYNILWKTGDSVTFMCDASTSWVTASRNIHNRFVADVYQASGQSHSGYTKIQFDTKRNDYNDDFDITTNYYYTAPITGRYCLCGSVSWVSMTAGLFSVTAKKNGTTEVSGYNSYTPSTTNLSLNYHDTFDLVAGDTVEIGGTPVGTKTTDVSAEGFTCFRIYLVSR